MHRRLAALALLVIVAACVSEDPFVYRGPFRVGIGKAPDPVRTTGSFSVCYGGGDEAKARDLGEETCREYGLQSLLLSVTRYQCTVSAPYSYMFACVNPAMRMANGTYVRPFNKVSVKAWKAEQKRLGHSGEVPNAPAGMAPVEAAPLDAAPATDAEPPAGGWGDAWEHGTATER